MASITLQVAYQFPSGTSVAAYQTAEMPTGQAGAPAGTAAETKTVASDGTLTYTSLGAGLEYVAHAVVSGRDRYVEFRTQDATTVRVPLSGATSGQTIDAYTGLPISVVRGSGYSLLATDETDLAAQVATLPAGTRYVFNIVDADGTWSNLGTGVA